MTVASEPQSPEDRARSALRTHDWRGALEILNTLEPTVEGLLDKALALRMLHDLEGAVAALDGALALEPRSFLALLSKGALLERLGQRKDAANVYKNAIAVAPADDQMPEALAAPFARGRAMYETYITALGEHLRTRVSATRARYPGERLDRFDESLDIFSGATRAFSQQPLLLHYPRLPAIPFYDRALFPWLADLEAATPVIQAELAHAMAVSADDFVPYVAYPPGVPVDQWAELNHSRRWNTFFLWRHGTRRDDACAICPRTAALMESLPIAEQPDFSPNVTFSVLEPHTRIPPHTGSSNIRLLVHLPLVLPGPARFRVGNITRDWRMGEAWVFDDTIEHEAWNDADEPRVILIFDIWNPYLSEAERELVSAMMSAKNEFQTS